MGVFDTSDASDDHADAMLNRTSTAPTLEAVAVGVYPAWNGGTKGQRYTYGSRTTGTHHFNNVQLLNSTPAGLGVKTGFKLDAAQTTLTIAVSLPRASFPMLPSLATPNVTTGFDLSCTMSGHNKFWWENRDFVCSSVTYDEGEESEFYIGGWGRAVFA